MRAQSVLHSCVAIGVPSIYCCMLLRASFSGLELAVLTLAAAGGIVGAIWEMLVITRSRNASAAVRTYAKLYRGAQLGVRHASATALLVLVTVTVSFGLSMELERWAFGVIEGLRLATVVLVGLTIWRLASGLWWIPVVTLVVADLALFANLPVVRPIDQWCTYFGSMIGIYALLESQHFLDRLLGLKRDTSPPLGTRPRRN